MSVSQHTIWKDGKYQAWLETRGGIRYLAVRDGQKGEVLISTEMFEFIREVWRITGDSVGHDRT